MYGEQININEIRKLKWEDIKDDLLPLIDYKNVTRTRLNSLFSNSIGEIGKDGEITVKRAKYYCTDFFDLPDKILPNQLGPVKYTTIGIFLFNCFCICYPFDYKFAYINEVLDEKKFGKMCKKIGNMLLNHEIDVSQFGKFANAIDWLGYQTEIFMPGPSLGIIIPNENVAKKKQELLKEHPEFNNNASVDSAVAAKYIDTIEKPLLDVAKSELAKDPSGRLYNLKKPGLGNNYKNSNITNGPLPDMINQGNYILVENSFTDGTDKESYTALANKALMGSYSRGVATQRGGTYAKYVNIVMQSVKAGPKGSDCGSPYYANFKIDNNNKDTIELAYGLINGKITLLTMDIINKYVGKVIKLRTPMFCKMKGCICNICMGNKLYQLDIKNIGMASNIPADKVKNASMKRIHNMAMNTIKPPITDFFEFIK